MHFRSPTPIFLQIAEHIIQLVISEKWKEGNRIPSVRDFAADVEVNPNTVVRTYNLLSQEGIISNKRGVGYFLNKNAKKLSTAYLKKQFVTEELPYLIKMMKTLDINVEDLKKKYNEKK